MSMLIAFAPFIVFAVLERLSSVVPALAAAALVSAIFLVRDALAPNRRVKLLEIGSLLLFGGLCAYAASTGVAWSVLGVRLRVDGGLLLIVLLSLALRQPFTLQYAKERVAPELWRTPRFVHVNTVLTGVWALAFALMVAADVVMLYLPSVPIGFGVAVTVIAIVAAFKFTGWYPAHVAARQAPSAGATSG